jgi:hypothetical protein
MQIYLGCTRSKVVPGGSQLGFATGIERADIYMSRLNHLPGESERSLAFVAYRKHARACQQACVCVLPALETAGRRSKLFGHRAETNHTLAVVQSSGNLQELYSQMPDTPIDKSLARLARSTKLGADTGQGGDVKAKKCRIRSRPVPHPKVTAGCALVMAHGDLLMLPVFDIESRLRVSHYS